MRSERSDVSFLSKKSLNSPAVTPSVSSATTSSCSDGYRTYGPHRDPRIYPRLDQIKKMIPRHCFKIDTNRGIYYLFKDYCQVLVVFFCSPLFEFFGLPGLLLWYCVFTIVFFSLFSISHDGWHRSLAKNHLLNDILGHFASAPMLMPFFSFRISHHKHHAHTNHVGKDAHHVWFTEKTVKEAEWWKLLIMRCPLTQPFALHIFYLILGFSDGSHYWPFGSMFKNNTERIQCAISSASCIGFATGVLWLFDWRLVPWLKYYIVPVLLLGLLINIVTYLQHFDYYSEAYGDEEWHHVRAQLQTVDRTYGFGMEYIGHNLTDGHVCHHLFTRIPHYHLKEATMALVKALEGFKGTPYEYKHVTTYDFLPRHFVYQYYLDYLIERAKGVFHFRVRVEDEQRVQ